MKSRRLIQLGLAVVILAVGWWFWSSRSSSLLPKDRPKIADGGAANIPQSSSRVLTTDTHPSPEASLAQPKPKDVAMKEILAAENARLLDFYGKVVDQDDQPVGGVT